MPFDMQATAAVLVSGGKGILAADETPGTLTRRFSVLGISSTPESRRAYREMLFRAPGLENHIGGVILQDETWRQCEANGVPLPQMLTERGIIPGIKVDNGAKPLAGCPRESITEGLDGLRDRLEAYQKSGARFTKWRAVIRISGALPSRACIEANAQALSRYAALAQEEGLVPIVEPEVLMDGPHSLERCDQVTGQVLHAVFDALHEAGVTLEAMLLKPNMVIAGKDAPDQPGIPEVAAATLHRLRQHVPPAVPAIVFLSGGQSAELATAHLDAINRLPGPKPWALSFSYGRALQDPALSVWGGDENHIAAGALALLHRARCNWAAAQGTYAADLDDVAFAAMPSEVQLRPSGPVH